MSAIREKTIAGLKAGDSFTVTRTFMRLAFNWLGEKVQSNKLLLGI